jgi:hypothetical protein
VNVSAGSHVAHHTDDFIWHQGVTHSGMDQGMLTFPSDEDTAASETSSLDPEISVCQVTAADRDDFHDEDWGTVEFAREHSFEDYDKWFHEEEEECNMDTNHDVLR